MPELMPPDWLIRVAVAAVWLYEGLWCKLLRGEPREFEVVKAVPRYGPRLGVPFLMTLGVVEVTFGLWVLSGAAPLLCVDCPNRIAGFPERERPDLGAGRHSRPTRDDREELCVPRAGLGGRQPTRKDVAVSTAVTVWQRGRLDARVGPRQVLFGRMYEDASIELDAFLAGGPRVLYRVGGLHGDEARSAS